MNEHRSGDDAFVERISQPLRAVEEVDEGFDARVMLGLRGATFQERKSWWRRPRTLRVTPLASLAMAAGVVALIVGGLAVRDWRGPATGSAARSASASTASDTVHVVRFVFVDSSATRIHLVGAFNQWQKDATPLRPAGVPGVWTVDVPLPSGRHEYAFIVADTAGEHWVADPLAMPVRDEFGTESSIISLRPSTTS